MSKYYKAEDIERILKEVSEEPNYLHPEEDWLDGVCIVETRIESLPTIEANEDCISREGLLKSFGLSEKTRKYGGDHSGYNTMMLYEIQDYIEDAPSVVPIADNLSAVEDCISKEYIKGICEFMLDEEMLGHMLGYIEEAPSVVPTTKPQKIGYCNECKWFRDKQVCGRCRSKNLYAPKDEPQGVTTEQSCDTCKYRELYECSDCRFGSKWERIDE